MVVVQEEQENTESANKTRDTCTDEKWGANSGEKGCREMGFSPD